MSELNTTYSRPSIFYALGVTLTLVSFPFLAIAAITANEIKKIVETKTESVQKEIKDTKLQEIEEEEEGFTSISFDESHMCEYTGVPMNFLCPITHEVMEEPVIIETGHTYEKSAIEYWLKENTTCPLTGLEVKSKKLQSNYYLKSSIDEWKVKNPEIDL